MRRTLTDLHLSAKSSSIRTWRAIVGELILTAVALAAGVLLVDVTRFTGGFSVLTAHEGQWCAGLTGAIGGVLWLMLRRPGEGLGRGLSGGGAGGAWRWGAALLRAAYRASLALLVLAALDHARYRALATSDDALGSPVVAFAACVLVLLALSALVDLPRWRTLGPTLPAGFALLLGYAAPVLALLAPVSFDVEGLLWPTVALACALLGSCLASWLAEVGSACKRASGDQAPTSGPTAPGRAPGEITNGN
jgi:hypothetical protein